MPVLNNTNTAPVVSETAVPTLNSQPLQHGLDAKLEAFMGANKDLFSNISDAPPVAGLKLTQDSPGPDVAVSQEPAKSADPVEQAAADAQAKPVADEAAERKAYIKKDKEVRKAKEELKTVKQKADAYEAIQAAKTSKNPNKILEAAGLDPNEFYNMVIEEAKNDKKATLDPKEQAINDKLTAYEKRVQEAENKAASLEQQREIDNTITNLVLPIVVKTPADYETLLMLKQGDHRKVAQYIFDTAAAIHQQTGEVVPLDQVAAQLEKYEWDKIETGYNAVSKMNKFAAKYGSQSEKQPSVTDKTDVRQPDNRQQNNIVKQQPASQPVRSIYEPVSQDDRVADALKRAGLSS